MVGQPIPIGNRKDERVVRETDEAGAAGIGLWHHRQDDERLFFRMITLTLFATFGEERDCGWI